VGAVHQDFCDGQRGVHPKLVQYLLAVVCWGEMCGLGSIEIGALGSVNTLPSDHKSVTPESPSRLLTDINKPLLEHASITITLDHYSHWILSMGGHAAEGMDEALA
jgi:hypothetical protein